MLQMGARLSNITRAAQSHAADSLSMNGISACSPGIQLSKLLGSLALARGLSCKIRLTPPNG